MSQISDQQLVAALQRSEAGAYELYGQLYGNRLFKYLAARTKNLQDAEDLHGDILIKALRSWKPTGGSSLKTWLYMLARQALDAWAEKQIERKEVSLEALMEAGFQPRARRVASPVRVRHSEALDKLRQTAQTLPPRERQLYDLCIREELSDEQVAQLMGVKPSSVKTMRLRLIRKIIEHMTR